MTVKLLEQKVQTLEKRLHELERKEPSALNDEERAARTRKALLSLAGMWEKKPRTNKDLLRVRKQIWG